jgi:hypothetical protein
MNASEPKPPAAATSATKTATKRKPPEKRKVAPRAAAASAPATGEPTLDPDTAAIAASRQRLTPEQQAELDAQLAAKYKPEGDFSEDAALAEESAGTTGAAVTDDHSDAALDQDSGDATAKIAAARATVIDGTDFHGELMGRVVDAPDPFDRLEGTRSRATGAADAMRGVRRVEPAPEDQTQAVGRRVDYGPEAARDRDRPTGANVEVDLSDPLDQALGTRVRRSPHYFDWCVEPATGHRYKFSRHYYDINVVVDHFADAGAAVQREVATKISLLRAHNQRCEFDATEAAAELGGAQKRQAALDRRIGYISHVVGAMPSVADLRRARDDRELVSTIAASSSQQFAGFDPFGNIRDMSAQTLAFDPPVAARR